MTGTVLVFHACDDVFETIESPSSPFVDQLPQTAIAEFIRMGALSRRHIALDRGLRTSMALK